VITKSLPACLLVVALMSAGPAAAAAPPRTTQPGDHMVRAGVGVLVAGIVAYALLGAGLAVGSAAEQDITSLARAEDLQRRRDLLARGRLGNQLAIAGGVLAVVSMGVGIPLVVVGRRRHQRAVSRIEAQPTSAGALLSLRIRW
jgi:hypothetical protein